MNFDLLSVRLLQFAACWSTSDLMFARLTDTRRYSLLDWLHALCNGQQSKWIVIAAAVVTYHQAISNNFGDGWTRRMTVEQM